ncbi:hypothetical protein [Frondihabitans peucedani]|uniref:Lipoprotein n=1 Tax=Frondihabitans peucedani TaxID=598626 RepID=A0ABP8E264_9MICO
MRTSHISPAVAVVVLLVAPLLAGCASAGPPGAAQPSPWSSVRATVGDAVRAVAPAGAWTVSVAAPDPARCGALEAEFDDQRQIPESAGTTVAWSGSVPAASGEGDGRRILRGDIRREWQAHGLVTRTDPPDGPGSTGRLVATLPRSQQLVLTASREGARWIVEARVACYTAGLPSAVPGTAGLPSAAPGALGLPSPGQ